MTNFKNYRYLEVYQQDFQPDNAGEGESEQILTNQAGEQSETRTLSHKEDTLFNPLKVFQLIRNLVLTLPNFEKELHRDHERSKFTQIIHLIKIHTDAKPDINLIFNLEFLKVLENARKGTDFPQQKDLDAAVEGLLRVQDAYDLDVFSVIY